MTQALRRSFSTAIGLVLLALCARYFGLFDALTATFLGPPEFKKACESAGIRFISAPREPVRSISLDFVPQQATQWGRRYEFSTLGRLERVGTLFWQPRLEEQVEKFELRGETKYPNGQRKFVQYLGGVAQPVAIDEPTSDVQVLDTVSNPNERQKPLWQQGMVQHELVVTDRRNGETLAKMAFTVDLAGHRGCGKNTKDAIDIDASFVLQAAGIPVRIPAHEQKRRANAIVKNW